MRLVSRRKAEEIEQLTKWDGLHLRRPEIWVRFVVSGSQYGVSKEMGRGSTLVGFGDCVLIVPLVQCMEDF